MALRWCGVPGTATYNTDVDLRHKNYCVWMKLWNTVWPYVSIVNVYMQKDIVYVVRLGKRLSRDENQSLCQNRNFSFRLRNTGNTGIPAYQEESRKILFLCIYFRKWKQNIDLIPEREFNILLSLSERKCRETNSFCFLPGSFNQYAGISCGPKLKTEISVLAQTFVFVSAQPLAWDEGWFRLDLRTDCDLPLPDIVLSVNKYLISKLTRINKTIEDGDTATWPNGNHWSIRPYGKIRTKERFERIEHRRNQKK